MSILETKKFLFIIGSARSGTSWLRHMLASHPAVASTIETAIYAKYLSQPFEMWRGEKAVTETGRWLKGLPPLLQEKQFYGWIQQLLEMTYGVISSQKPSAQYILDKGPENTFHLNIIKCFLPEAKFVHLIRDGRDVVCSMRNVKRKVGHQTENISEGARLWRRYVEAARSISHDTPHYMEIRYEDLLEKPAETLRDIFAFYGINAGENEVQEIVANSTFDKMRSELPSADSRFGKGNPGHYHKGKAGTWEQELSREDLRLFCEEAGDLLVELGYADQKWVKEHLRRPILGRIAAWIRGRLFFFTGFVFGTKAAQKSIFVKH